MRRRFGATVADIVHSCSAALDSPRPPWRERKVASIDHLRQASDDVRLVALADRLYNARAIRRDHHRVGDDAWDRFTADRVGTLWYSGALVDAFRAGEPSPLAVLVEEFAAVVAALDPSRRSSVVDRFSFTPLECGHEVHYGASETGT